MSIHHLPPPSTPAEEDYSQSSSYSESEDDDQDFEDWISDSQNHIGVRSLFDDKTLKSVDEVLRYDLETHKFDLEGQVKRMKLDGYGRIRLINFIRKTKPEPGNLSTLTGAESFFSSDEFLIPAIADDPLLQTQQDDWSDSDDENTSDPARKIKALEAKLAQSQAEFARYREAVSQKLDFLQSDDSPSSSSGAKDRDDDTHYFDSYGQNDIHAVMIQDRVRTSTYAHFILTNPSLFVDAVVLDVGCGTGILSLFAARAGAKKVYAVDASDIADKAREIVKKNGMDNIVQVIKGKVEAIELPEKVDIIISEWMGYALLYESMLDSVLTARDRFLKTEQDVEEGETPGVMAPSQCQMMLGLCDATEIVRDRVTFWNDVYGFEMSTMSTDLYEEAIVDVVGPDTMLSEPFVVKDLNLRTITSKHLNFSSHFTLHSTTERKTKVTALILYFDTFFTTTGKPIHPTTQVKVIKDGDAVLAEIWPVGGKRPAQRRASQSSVKDSIGKVTSFSTGPKSIPTHWKQTLFLLKEPIVVDEGTVVQGNFHCRKSETNSRELEVEIHYTVKQPGSEEQSSMVVQIYKVR